MLRGAFTERNCVSSVLERSGRSLSPAHTFPTPSARVQLGASVPLLAGTGEGTRFKSQYLQKEQQLEMRKLP